MLQASAGDGERAKAAAQATDSEDRQQYKSPDACRQDYLDYLMRNYTRGDMVRTVASAPAGSHRAIKYPVAIVRRSKQPEDAREYVTFLRSVPARKIFEKHGFTVAQ